MIAASGFDAAATYAAWVFVSLFAVGLAVLIFKFRRTKYEGDYYREGALWFEQDRSLTPHRRRQLISSTLNNLSAVKDREAKESRFRGLFARPVAPLPEAEPADDEDIFAWYDRHLEALPASRPKELGR